MDYGQDLEETFSACAFDFRSSTSEHKYKVCYLQGPDRGKAFYIHGVGVFAHPQ